MWRNHALLLIALAVGAVIVPRCESKPKVETIACLPVTECPPYLKVLLKRPLTPERIAIVRAASCGFQGLVEKVWCPIIRSQINEVSVDPDELHNDEGVASVTPRTSGVIKSTRESTIVESRDMATIPPEVVEITPLPLMHKKEEVDTESKRNSKAHLFPTAAQCGKFSTLFNDDRVFGGETTELDEFPWTAMLIYRNRNNRFLPGCGGSLISKRYVITAAHCVSKQAPPAMVVLGEYDTRNATDCVHFYDGKECSPPPLQLRIENVTLHPDWEQIGDRRPFYHDIALLRLERDVEFNDFVAPVCLMQKSLEMPAGSLLVAAGWGLTEEHARSDVKKKVVLPLVARQNCSKQLQVRIGSGQVCAGGVRSQDTCKGDSGGPLMYLPPTVVRWQLAGLVSLGIKNCGLDGMPAIYTWLPPYLDWIYDTVY